MSKPKQSEMMEKLYGSQIGVLTISPAKVPSSFKHAWLSQI